MASVAQLVRALVCGAGGRGFKTHRSPQVKYPIGTDGVFYLGLVQLGVWQMTQKKQLGK